MNHLSPRSLLPPLEYHLSLTGFRKYHLSLTKLSRTVPINYLSPTALTGASRTSRINYLSLPGLLLACALLAAFPARAGAYVVGDTLDDFTFTDYRTGEEVSLYELGEGGGVLVLEWFAWWCPFCARAAGNVETGIVQYYGAKGGNKHGLPVRHIALNVQGGARDQSDTFIATYGMGTVLEDYDRAYFYQFNYGGGQPLFAIINAEPDSPSAGRWELLYTRLNYAGNEAPDISALMRPVIDSIMPGVVPPMVEDVFPMAGTAVEGWRRSPWFGWFQPDGFPIVYHPRLGFAWAEAGAEGHVYLYSPELGWIWTGPEMFPIVYSYREGAWLIPPWE